MPCPHSNRPDACTSRCSLCTSAAYGDAFVQRVTGEDVPAIAPTRAEPAEVAPARRAARARGRRLTKAALSERRSAAARARWTQQASVVENDKENSHD